MDQSGIHIGDVRQLLHRVLDDWRADERKKARDQIRNIEDTIEKHDLRRSPDTSEKFVPDLRKMADDGRASMERKFAMIDEAHRQMVDFVNARQVEPVA